MRRSLRGRFRPERTHAARSPILQPLKQTITVGPINTCNGGERAMKIFTEFGVAAKAIGCEAGLFLVPGKPSSLAESEATLEELLDQLSRINSLMRFAASSV